MRRSVLVLASIVLTTIVGVAHANPKGDVIKDLRTSSANIESGQQGIVASEVLISRSEEKALGHLKTLIKKYRGTSMEPELKFRLAELYMNRAKSARFIEQMVADDEGVASFLPSKIKSLKERKMVEEAIAEYTGIEKRFPKYKAVDEVIFNKAFAQLQIDQEKQAEQSFIKLLRTQKRSRLRPDAFLAVGEINFKRRNFRKALAYFNRVKKYKTARVYPYALYKGSWCYHNLDGYEQAMSELENVIYFGAKVEKEGRDQRMDLRVEALTDMSLFYSSIRPAKDAVSYFRELSGTKDPLPALRKLARIYEKHGKDVKQEIVLTDLIKAFPGSIKRPFFHSSLARNLNRQLKYQKSVAHLWSFYRTCKGASAEAEQEEPCKEEVDTLSRRLAIKWLKVYKENKTRLIMSAVSENAFRVHLADKKPEDDNSKMRYLFSEHLFELKKYAESSDEYTKVGDSSKDKERHHKARYAAIVAYDLSHNSNIKGKAIPRFRFLSEVYMKEFPKGEKYLDVGFKLGLFDYTNKEYDLAAPLLVKLGNEFSQLTKGKKSQDLYLDILNSKKEYIEIQKFAKKWKATEKEAVRISALQNIYEQAFFSEVAILEKKKEYAKSIARYTSFIKENPASKLVDEARWNKIGLHFKLKEYDKTAEGYISFHRLHPKHTNAISGLIKAVEIYEMMAEPKPAHRVSEILIKADVKNAQRWNFLSANYLKASGQYETAAKKFLNIYYTSGAKSEFRNFARDEFFAMKDQLIARSSWYKERIKGLMKSGSRTVASTAVRSYAEHLYTEGGGKEFNSFIAANKWKKGLNPEKQAILHMYDGKRKEGWFFSEKLESKTMDLIVKSIQAKTKRMDQVQRAYQRSLADEDPRVSIQALLGLSRVYQQYVNELKTLEPPSTFSKEEVDALKAELSNIIMPFEEKAAEAVDQALKVATDAKIKDGSLRKIKILFDQVNLDEKVVYPVSLNLPNPIGPRGY
ncbi:MAG: tetratricopeptide repeat protein [Bdellovibrionales bacterium]